MKILVTGGAGYIGAVLVPHLLDEGHEVTVLDNFLYGQGSLLDCCHDPRLSIVRGDARNETLVTEFLRRADAILPLACLTGAPLCDKYPQEARSVNLDAIALILKHLSPSQWVIFPTTNSGYGVGETDVFCTETTPLRPVSLYGQLKVDAETLVLDRHGRVVESFRP